MVQFYDWGRRQLIFGLVQMGFATPYRVVSHFWTASSEKGKTKKKAEYDKAKLSMLLP